MRHATHPFLLAAALAATCGLTAPTFAQDTTQVPVLDGAADEVNTGGLSFEWGTDLTTAYFFRGIVQEDQGIIVQPFAEVTLNNLFDADQELSLTLGIWNSFHDQQTGASPGEGADIWYEADLYASLGLAVTEELSVGVVYTAYTSPNGAFSTIQEVGLEATYENTLEISDGFAFDYEAGAGIYFELDNGADGFEEGIYAELGFTPSFTYDIMDQEVAFRVPMVVGLSVADYYEQADGTGGTDDDTVGYASVGLVGEVPITAIPERYGDYTFSAGVTLLWLNDHAQDINGGQDHEVIGTIGISGSY